MHVKGIKNHKFFKPAKSAGHGKAARARFTTQAELEAEEEEEVPQVNLIVLGILLIAVTVLDKCYGCYLSSYS